MQTGALLQARYGVVNGGFAVAQVGMPQSLGFMLQGLILFFVLGIGDLLSRYRIVLLGRQPRVSSKPLQSLAT